MKTTDKTIIALVSVALILTAAIIILAASWPQAPPENVIVYRGWSIYQPSSNSTQSGLYVATKPGQNPIYGVDLPDLIADIDEAMR